MKTRIPPSPTGFMHVGNLRTALFDYLLAKKHGGIFLLRIEDTDRERLVDGATESIIQTLAWAGIEPDEGPYLKNGKLLEVGDNGPYVQSKRLSIYNEHIQGLLEQNHAYYCFCTKDRLDDLRQMQQANKQATGYDGHCRTLSVEEVKKRLEAGEQHVIRLKVPNTGKTEFTDLIRGTVSVENARIDDQVLMKADGFPTYHLAVVVDDHLMNVTHVIRGEEWVSSTPKHVLLYTMFGWELPAFAHLPLLVNEKKQKLSKRHGDVAVEDFIEQGYLPEALINFLAFLGWNPGDDREIMNLDELIQAFDVAKVSKSAAVFNREKLDWYNKQYMMNMNLDELTERAKPFFKKAGIGDEDMMRKAVALERSRANTLAELVDATAFLFADSLEYDRSLLAWKKSTYEDAKQKITELSQLLEAIPTGEWNQETLDARIFKWIEKKAYGKGDVLWPMRVALSGEKHSPGPTEIAAALGKEGTIRRLQAIS